MREKPEISENNIRDTAALIDISKLEEAAVGAVKAIETESGLAQWSLEDYQKEISRPDSRAFIAKHKEKVIGFIIARLITAENSEGFPLEEKSNEKGNEIEIYNLAVKKEWRNSGVAQALTDELLKHARASGVGEIWLEARESNDAALAFYKKNGFCRVYIRKNFYRSPAENAVVMNLKL